ncbi:amino acid adenylation domain-containing protein [Nostoc sp. XA010]|uniref:non-ribosomal peptide synthetase n=1 Tax=Nostoc sp. XA010 TaxID=2780407 RepID=UPI001E43A19D|nr:non-ribosomal peptide synthetase [Nostoc sp. XA010]MCC5661303.1 amino acid adenylation domain-containing protein [Nostoc sp. XA010]
MTKYLNSFPFSTFVELLNYRALYQPNKIGFQFLHDGKTVTATLTYQELHKQAKAIASQLKSTGVVEGECALLLYPPGLEFISAFFACLYAGVVAVPAYPPHLNRPTPRLQAIIANTQTRIALTTEQILANGPRLFEHTPQLQALQYIATDCLTDSLADNWEEIGIASNAIAFLQYTSGSTSTPKGVMVSHENLLHNQRLIQLGFGHTEETTVVGWLPLFHDMGLIGNMLQPLYLGRPCILMPPVAFLQNPFHWLQAISQYKATTSGGPNFAYDLCVRRITPEQKATLDLSSWEVAFNGAEPIRAETIERFTETFASCGFKREVFYPCYGMAETTLIVSGGNKKAPPILQAVEKAALEQNQVIPTNLTDATAQKLVSCGQPLGDLHVVIANPKTLTKCSPSEVGEIWVAGSSVTQGYWRKSQQTQSTFQAYLQHTHEGPFLRTGDLGFFHAGELFITGRLKDLIIIRGRNHYPQDIELTVEKSHPALQPTCSAAFSVDVADEEKLAVVVELKRSHLRSFDVEEVARAIRQAVAENSELQVYGILLLKPGSILKTSSGKIQRQACRTSFLNGSLDVVGSSILEKSDVVTEKDSLTCEALQAIAPEEQKPLLEAYLLVKVAKMLCINHSQLHPQQPLTTLGLDSLNAVELKNNIEGNFGVELSATSLLEGCSIAQLVDEIQTQLTLPSATLKITPTPAKTRSKEHPLSYGQRSLWFMHKLAPESTAYNIVNAVRLRGELNISALQSSIQKLVERHPALRTNFITVEGEPVGQINDESKVFIVTEEISTWSEASLNAHLIAEARPFNLEQDPLMRVKLFARSPQEHILLLTVHHIIADFWSLAVFVQELGILYQAEIAGTPAILTPLTLEYSDYSMWQAEVLASPEGERLWKYWQQQLADLPVLNLPTDRPRPSVQTYRGALVSLDLNEQLTEKLKLLSRSQGATLYMTLLAAYQILLYRLSGQEDILVGSPTAGRNEAELAGLFGYFANPVVLRANLSGNPTFETFLSQVRRTALNAFAHQDYPLTLLVERLQPTRDASRTPLFQTMFVLQKAYMLHEQGLTVFALGDGAKMNLGGLSMESLALEQRSAQFDLTLAMAEVGDKLAASFEYNTNLFDTATINRMAGHFLCLLESIVSNPQQSISALPLLTSAERNQLLVWNATKTNYPNVCLHQLFTQQVEATPDAIAVVCQNQQLTYRELNHRANQLAHYLQVLGVKPEVRVGIYIERSLEMVIGVLGILKAGGAYVPFDPMYPQERIAWILEDAGINILLTQHSLVANLAKSPDYVVCLDTDSQIDQYSTENPLASVSSANLAYIIYTSGSTGKPKGVMIPHLGIINRLVWGITNYQITPTDKILQKTSFSFDVAVWELFTPLLAGGCLVMAKPGGHQDPSYLVRTIAQQQITIVDFVPAMLQLILEEPGLEACKALRHVTCGGEALTKAVCDRFFTRLNQVELHNCYGPTEVSIDATSWVCQPGSSVISIGRAIDNVEVYILDADLQPVPIGVAGELCIGGAGLARGYLNCPELTDTKFISHPFSEAEARLYKTGDLARYLCDGNIEFLGRLDNQVKLRGFRLELGEIEAVLRCHPDVKDVVVLLQGATDSDAARKQLVAYLVPKSETNLDEQLHIYLSRHLPEYMIPSAFVTIPEMPRMPNGKLDYRALSKLEISRWESTATYISPSNAVEEVLVGIWSEVLQMPVEGVGIHDNFFKLGGHSLLAIQVISRIQDIFRIELPLHSLFEATTVAHLSNILIARETKPGQVEKIAQVMKHITSMSDEVMKETLKYKKNKTYAE